MSLTATLLFNQPIKLPNGRRRTHNMDARRRYDPTAGRLDYNARNAATKAANIERVFNAIDDGHETVVKIMKAVGLSKSTVLKAINDLQDWPTGARIRRVTGQSHRFYVL